MPNCIIHLVLLADQERWKDLGRGFRGENARLQGSEIAICLGMVALAALVIFILARVLARQEGGRQHHSGRALFNSLCQAHSLSRAEALLLKKMAWHYQQPEPAQLFLMPAKFQPSALPAALHAQRRQVESLRERIFALPAAAGGPS